MFKEFVNFIKTQFPHRDFIPLHEPCFIGNEKKYLNDCIDSTFVSSVGQYVDLFEEKMCELTGAKHCIAIVNGTNALHLSLLLAGVKNGDEVLTQSLSFIATANAIKYCNANPHFVDVDRETLGLSPTLLKKYLAEIAEVKDGTCYNKKTGKKIAACVPMHTFGLPIYIDELVQVCNKYHIPVVEDAAESLGSFYKKKHTGTFGLLGTFSFNGNKTITCGGGGAIVTNDDELAKKAKHLSTQAKVPHQWEYMHDEIGYNYRMPNINAALACAQLEQLEKFITNKRDLAKTYHKFFNDMGIDFVPETKEARSNYWLNAVLFKDKKERDQFLEYSNNNGVMTRPVWELMTNLPLFKECQQDGLENSKWLAERVVNIPSSVRM
jgi:aminotransferase in exopolysaccharide biosynthesis